MLSRVADSLYWMSRYLERAEHTARLLDVNLYRMLDQSPESAAYRWDRLLASLQASAPGPALEPYAITQALTFDHANPASIVSSITAARENARQVREQISSEMWEQINRLYLDVWGTQMEQVWSGEPHEFFRAVKDGAHLFQGVTDATMSHGEGWQFIQVGRYIERAQATAALLDVHFAAFRESLELYDYLEWVSLLKSCTSFEAYCKVYTADVRPERVAEFLLLSDDSPRSVRFAVDRLESALRTIARATRQRNAGRAERLAGRLRATLDYAQMDEIMTDMHGFLEDVERQCAQLHTAIYQIYIAYPIDAALSQ